MGQDKLGNFIAYENLQICEAGVPMTSLLGIETASGSEFSSSLRLETVQLRYRLRLLPVVDV
jgi:hypothetical protein